MKRYPGTFFLLFTSIILQVLITYFPHFGDTFCFRPSGGFLGWVGLITYQVSHADWGHLIGNFRFGLPFMLYYEHRFGKKQLLEFFVLCGVFSAFFQMVLGGAGQYLHLIGSSGSIFGVMAGACIAFGERGLEHFVGLFFLLLLFVGQLALAPEGFQYGVAFYGHIGGAVGGMVLSTRIYRS